MFVPYVTFLERDRVLPLQELLESRSKQVSSTAECAMDVVAYLNEVKRVAATIRGHLVKIIGAMRHGDLVSLATGGGGSSDSPVVS